MKLRKKFKGMLGLALTAMLTLGSVTANATPNEGTVLPDPDRAGSITIHKYAMDSMPNPGTPASGLEIKEENNNLGDLPEGAKPLAGVSFKIEKVADDTLPEQIKGTDTSKVLRDSNFEAKIITTGNGENGTVKGEASINDLPQGIYLVTELENAGVLQKGNPFLVSIPMAHPTNPNSWLYDVHVYPKNVIDKGRPTIDKSVTTSGNKHDSANINQDILWIIEPQIPKDIATAVTYKVVDKLDEKLSYKKFGTVSFINKYGEPVELVKGQDYLLTEPTETKGGKLTIEFTAAGKQLLATALVDGQPLPKVQISFTTVINEDANLGEPIYNNANLVYTNTFNDIIAIDPTTPEEELPPTVDPENPPVIDVPTSGNDKPEVHTGGIQIEKVDASNNTVKLPGAKFKIYTSLKDAQNNENPILNPETGEVWEIITDDKGIATFRGLSYGSAELDKDGNLIKPGKDHLNGTTTYWLVETEAPWYDSNGDGEKDKQYNLLREPVAVTIDGTKTALKIVTVENRKFTLPVTGGVGTVIFTLGGLAIMGAAAFLYMRTTKRA